MDTDLEDSFTSDVESDDHGIEIISELEEVFEVEAFEDDDLQDSSELDMSSASQAEDASADSDSNSSDGGEEEEGDSSEDAADREADESYTVLHGAAGGSTFAAAFETLLHPLHTSYCMTPNSISSTVRPSLLHVRHVMWEFGSGRARHCLKLGRKPTRHMEHHCRINQQRQFHLPSFLYEAHLSRYLTGHSAVPLCAVHCAVHMDRGWRC